MTLQDNIALPLSLGGVSGKECIRRAQEFCRNVWAGRAFAEISYQLFRRTEAQELPAGIDYRAGDHFLQMSLPGLWFKAGERTVGMV